MEVWTWLELYLTPNDGVLMNKNMEFEKLTWLLQRRHWTTHLRLKKKLKKETVYRNGTTTFILAGVYYYTTV
jgi:hypothetical protein